MDQSGAIGVFDSGLGGISILQALVRELPQEHFIYFGDTAHNPYGSKTEAEILARCEYIAEHLLEQGAKALVIACNTATSVGAAALRERYPELPIIGVEPALKPACENSNQGRVLVMATPVTLRLKKFQEALARFSGNCNVTCLPCPGLAPAIEAGKINTPEMQELLKDLLSEVEGKFDSVVLGCTHYPFVKDDIQSILGDIPCYDGRLGTARRLKAQLEEKNLLIGAPEGHAGEIVFESSSTDPTTLELYKRFYNLETRFSPYHN